MSTDYVVEDVQGIPSAAAINENLNDIAAELDEKLDRRARSDNQMKDDLDMDDNRVSNIKDAAQGQDVPSLNQVKDLDATALASVEAGITGLKALFGKTTTYIIGSDSFNTSDAAGVLTVTSGVLWIPSVANYEWREIDNDVEIDFSAEADGTYSVQVGQDNSLGYKSGQLTEGNEILYVDVLSGAIDSVTFAQSIIDTPVDFVDVRDSAENSTVYSTLDARLEQIEVDLNDNLDAPASVTDEAIPRFDGTAGELVQDSGVTISDSDEMDGARFRDYTEVVASVSSSSNTTTLDLDTARLFTSTLTEDTTVAFSNVPADNATSVTIIFTQDGTGGWTVAWPASVKWEDDTAPTITATAAAIDVVTLVTPDQGTTWYGFVGGQNFS